ncbi:DUF6879 family protein [Frankia sp. CiP3]|uniref:DUF6879 family protein n=1 Tax=Frankia sp. CiP3 TaxID=2880971 RepID=UPI0035AFF2EE
MEPGPEFAKLFETFEHTAYRLETRDRYSSPREVEPLRKFLAGEPDVSYHENWLSMVRQATAEGRRFSRVRVVSFPLTDYIRFGMWVAGYTREAGDDIRYITRDQAVELPKYDYWLFDSRKVLKMRFTDDDQFIGGEVIEDPAEIVEHNYWRDAAQHHAIDRDEFVAKYEQRDDRH